MKTTFAVGLRTHRGKRRWLGRRRFHPLQTRWRRHRSAAIQFERLADADRTARAEALAAAAASEVTVFRVDHIRGKHRWHTVSTFEARAAGGVVPYGPATAMQARIRPVGGDR